ncbi:MAG: HEAT repeat domain-containing protein [Planctomycetota bacterium]
MAIFGGKSSSLSALIEKVKTHSYRTNAELGVLLDQIFAHQDAKPKKLLWMLTASNPVVRQRSLEAIASMTGKSLVDLMVRAMSGQSEKLRYELAREVAKADESEVYRAIGPLIHSKDVEQRQIALEIISAHQSWSNFLGFLKKTLGDPEFSVRHRTAKILARGARNRTVRMMLIDLVEAGDAGVRREAIQALASNPGADLVEPFFARLPFEERVDQARMVDTLSALALNPNAKLEEHLIPILADENPEMRDIAVKLLAKMPNRTQVLRAYFIHSKGLATWLRARTTASILRLSDSLVEPLRELMEDHDLDVRVGAMLMIGESKDPSFVPLLEKIFKSDLDWWIRSIAVDVLAKRGSADVVNLLLSEIEDQELRYSIIAALGKIALPVTIAPLLECLADPRRGVRIATLEALAKKPTEQVARGIFLAARADKEKKVREKAAQVLGDLGNVASSYVKQLEEFRSEYDKASTSSCGELKMVNQDLN